MAALHERLEQKAWLLQQTDETGNTVGWIMDLDENTIEWSDSFYKMIGYLKVQPLNITEKTLFSIIHPHDGKAFRKHWEDAVLLRQAAAFSFRTMLRGAVRYMKAVFGHTAVNGKAYFIGTLQDTTGEQVLQQQLSQRVQLAESLTENIHDRVIITDSHNTILLWNRASEEAYGLKKAEAIGQNFFDVFPHLKTEADMQVFQRVQRGEKVVQEGIYSALGNGYYNLYLMPLYQEDEVTGVLHVINDVTRETELRNSLHDRLQLIESIVQSSVDRIIALDHNMNYLYWNRRAEEYYSLPKEAVIGKNILEVFPRLVNDPSYEELRKALRGKSVHLPADAEKDNYSETYLEPIKNAEGEVTSVLWITHDVSGEWSLQQEQRKAQAQLKEEHRRLKVAQAIGHVGSFDWDAATDTIYWSDEMFRIHGLEPERGAITLDKVLSFFHPDDTAAKEKLIRLRNEPGLLDFTHRIIRADGESRTVRRQIQSFAGKEGRVTHLTGTVQDITEQEEAKKRLAANEALLRNAEEVALTGSYEADLQQNTIRFSDGMYRLFGEEPGSFEPTFAFIDNRSHPDDAAAVKAILEQAAITKQPYRYTRRIYRKDGAQRIVEANGKVITDAVGNAIRFIGLVQDVTERKKAEEERNEHAHYLKRITETTPDMLSITELDTMQFTFLNEETFRANGFLPEEVASSAKGLQIIDPEDREELARYFQQFRTASDEAVINAEYRARANDGEWKWFSVRGKVFQRDESGKVTHILNAIENISGRRLAEQQLLQLKEEVAQKATDKYFTLFNAIDEGFYHCEVIFDADNRPVDILYLEENPAAVAILGISLIGKRLRDVNPGYGESWYQLWGEVVLTGESKRLQQYSEPDKKWFDLFISRLGDANNRQVLVVFRDITARLQEEGRQRYLVQLADSMRSLSDPDEVQYQAVCLLGRHLGVGRAFYCELEPDGNGMWIRRDYFDGVESQTGFFHISDFGPFLLKEYKAGRTVVIQDAATEPRLTEKDREGHLSANVRAFICVPWVKDNRLVSVLAVNQPGPRIWTALEITLVQETAERTWAAVERAKAEEALRKSEAQLSAVFEALPIGIGFINNSGQLVLSNEEMRRFLPTNLSPSEDEERYGRWVAYHPDGRLVERHDFPGARAMRGETVVPGTEMFYTADDGSQVWTRVAAVPIRDEEGQIVGQVSVVTDITLLKDAEEQLKDFALMLEQQVAARTKELQKNIAFVEEITQTTPDRITIHDAATMQIVYTNHPDFWKELYQNNELYQEAEEKRAIGLVHPDEQEKLKTFLQQRNSLGDGAASEVEIRLKGDKWVRIRSKVFQRDENGAASQIISFTTDMTAQKTGALEIQKNLAILQHAESLAQMGSWEYEIATGAFKWSEGMYNLFGLPQGAGVKPEIYLDFSAEEDRSVAKRIIKNLKKGHPDFEETLTIKRGRERRLLKIKASVVSDEKGKAQKLVGVDLDITDIREAEQKLEESKTLLEQTALASPDAITVYNLANTQPIYLNNCLAEWLGKTNDELVRMGIEGRLKFVHTDDRLRLLHFNEKLKACKDTTVLTLEYRLHAKNERSLWVRNRSKVFQRDSAGKVTHVLSVLQDITEEKAAEEAMKKLNAALEKKNAELESANDEITSFAFVASHDLKEPLRKIHTFSDWLLTQEAGLSATGKLNLEKLNNSVKRLDQLINDILALTKVQVSQERFKPVDLHALLQQVKEEMGEKLEKSGVVIEAGTLPVIIGAGNHLLYLLKNLVSNSIKFQPKEAAPRITITAGKDETYLKLVVADNGIGIAKEYHKKIFEMFKRLHSTGEYEGTGMGLAICKKIMDKHGGRITVESEPGKGAVFVCWFPLALSTS